MAQWSNGRVYEWENDAEKQRLNSAHSNTRVNGRLILTLCIVIPSFFAREAERSLSLQARK